MAQISISRHFCTRCGSPMEGDGRLCVDCSRSSDERASLPDGPQIAVDADATIRAKARFVPGLLEEQQAKIVEDDEKTARAATPLSSRTYTLAVRQEQHPLALPTKADEHASPPEQRFQWQLVLKKAKPCDKKSWLVLIGCTLGLLLLLSLLVLSLYSYNSNRRVDAQVVRNKGLLDAQISQARSVGVPASLLQPLLKQEQQLDSARNNLFITGLFDSATYQKLAQSYSVLSSKIPGVVALATEQAQQQAQQRVQDFQVTLSQAAVSGTVSYNLDNFSLQFSEVQLALETAKTPHDYAAISQNARQGILTIGAMENAGSQLSDFDATIGRLKAAHVDVTAMEAQYQNDLITFASARQVGDFQDLSALIDAQYQQVVVGSVQAFPYVSVTKLNELQNQVRQLTIYGLNARPYQQRLQADEIMMERANTVYDDLLFLKQVDADIASMHGGLVQGEAHYLVREFDEEVTTWAKAHPYYDSFDGHTYALDSGYMQQGIGASIDNDLASAQTTADYEAMVVEAQNALFNLSMLEADFNDHTPYNKVHATDLQMINHYKLQKRTVLMVSLVEQAMRVYQNGKLLRSFYVTTGRAELPSLPGVWATLNRQSPTTFKSADPEGSPYWFPDTPIKYAILYHWGGYFVHDAWWRASFGPDTQFPHQDAGGNTAYNFDGSHGCVNLTESDAAWVYQHTDWNTLIVIY